MVLSILRFTMSAVGELLPSERGFVHSRDLKGEGEPASAAQITPVEAINEAHACLVSTFKSGRSRNYDWRVAQLQGIRKLVDENKEEICQAVMADLGRPKMEAFLGELTAVIGEVDVALDNLRSWMEPESVATPLTQRPGYSEVVREPKGVVLAISPWNFPIALPLDSLVAILAAGNCCLMKPSEISPRSEELIKRLLPRYVDPEAVIVVTGGVAETTALLKLRWDHILYTGNGAVARVILRAAAEHLTPCTLELGGKSPTVVLPGADIPVAARRILSSKCLNAGQICIAPDYALVHESVEEALVQEMQTTLRSWYGEDASASDSFGRIVNQAHFRRIRRLIDTADGEVLQPQGKMEEASKFIPPTLIRGPGPKSPIMEEEIFGPVLPIVKKKSTDEMIEHINAGEKPLALYIFGPKDEADRIVGSTSSGGVCVNDTIMHFANPDLPFGGVGGSGMGRYHGKWGFDEFSHLRGVMYRSTWLDAPQRYPPFNDSNLKVMEKLLIGPLVPPSVKKAVTAIGGIGLAGAAALMLRSRL